MSELGRVRRLKALHLTFNREAGSLLPLAIRFGLNFIAFATVTT
jgi:Suppressor of Fused Gli/Ci N terminal binding domain